ncbi:MAG: zinc ribbon domain-containing protein, partial [Candidatus Bathyarchaeia archaeon]
WNARTFQFMLEYKLLWNNQPGKYVSPKDSSKTCPICSGSMASYGGRMMKCKKCGFKPSDAGSRVYPESPL